MTTMQIGGKNLTFNDFNTDGDATLSRDEVTKKLLAMGVTGDTLEFILTNVFGFDSDTSTIVSQAFETALAALDVIKAGGSVGSVTFDDVARYVFQKRAESGNASKVTENQFIQQMRELGLSDSAARDLFATYSGGDGSISQADYLRMIGDIDRLDDTSGFRLRLNSLAIIAAVALSSSSEYYSGANSLVRGLDEQIQDKSRQLGAGTNLNETVSISTDMGTLNAKLTSVLAIIADMKQMMKDAANPR